MRTRRACWVVENGQLGLREASECRPELDKASDRKRMDRDGVLMLWGGGMCVSACRDGLMEFRLQ